MFSTLRLCNVWMGILVGAITALTAASGASAQLIGVDFEHAADGTVSPNNWNVITGGTPQTIANTIDESGAFTGISFTLNNGSSFATTPLPGTLPQHSQSLAGLNDYYFATGVGTASFSGLVAGQEYYFWVFGLRGFTMNNLITVSGGGAPIQFTQIGTAGQLWVNNQLGSDAQSLQSYALVQTASANGMINFSFDITAGGAAGWTIAGLAIQAVPGPGALAMFGFVAVFGSRRRR